MTKRAGRGRYHMVRVCSPKRFAKDSFRTINLGKGIKGTVGCKKGKFAGGRCKVGTSIQRIMVPKSKYTFRQAKSIKRKKFRCQL